MSCQNWGSNSVKPRGEIYWQFLCTYSPKTSRNCLPTLLTTSDRYPTSWNSGEYTICTEQYIDFESSYFIISTFFKIHYCSDNSDAHSLLQSSTTSKLLNNITERLLDIICSVYWTSDLWPAPRTPQLLSVMTLPTPVTRLTVARQ